MQAAKKPTDTVTAKKVILTVDTINSLSAIGVAIPTTSDQVAACMEQVRESKSLSSPRVHSTVQYLYLYTTSTILRRICFTGVYVRHGARANMHSRSQMHSMQCLLCVERCRIRQNRWHFFQHCTYTFMYTACSSVSGIAVKIILHQDSRH
jgi:hypothetical protein